MPKARVLIVEDDSLVRELVTEVSPRQVFRSIRPRRVIRRQKLIDVDGYALILTDINMPGQRDGIEVAAHARSKKPGIPIIFVSGRPESLQNVRSTDAVTAILPKPYSFEALLRTVRNLLSVKD
jgi:two-component system OmpR family response regulator